MWDYDKNNLYPSAIVRLSDGTLEIFASCLFLTERGLRKELRRCGYKVLKTWNYGVTNEDAEQWLSDNRKKFELV